MALPTPGPGVTFTIEDPAPNDDATFELVRYEGRLKGTFNRRLTGTMMALRDNGLFEEVTPDSPIEPTANVITFNSEDLHPNVSTDTSKAVGGTYEYTAFLRVLGIGRDSDDLVRVLFGFEIDAQGGYTPDGDGRISFGDVATTGAGGVAPGRSLVVTAANPTVDDDSGEGYSVGSGWVNTSSGAAFVLVDATEGAAVWTSTTAGAGGGISNVVEDATPQLGGALDVNGQEITGAIDLHSTGDVVAELGDAAGVNKLSVRDSAAVEVAAVDSDGNITTSGTVDGRDLAADGTKLDGIETAATADQTGAEIKTAYEAEADTNAYDDAAVSKLAGIETAADVTDATNVAVAGAVMDSDISEGEGLVRKTGAGAYEALKTNLAAATAPGATDDSAAGYAVGSRWIDTTADKEYVCLDSTATAAVWTETTGGGGGISNVVEDATPQLGGALDVNGQEITGAIDLHSTGDIIAELGDAAGVNKLSVRDSGAVEVAAVDSDGNVTTSGTVDGRDLAADGTKLDGIETAATADQTGAEIKTAYEAEADTNAFTDAEQTKLAAVTGTNTGDEAAASTTVAGVVELLTTAELDTGTDTTRAATAAAIEASARSVKLDGIETAADVTDTTNVTAAGALMDSEVDADLKTLALPANTTITAAAATVLDDATVVAMVDTLGGATSTGTGGLARATSPTFVTPALGTPASGVATNLTGTASGLTAGLVTAAGAATFTDTNGIITATTIDGALQEVFQGAHDVNVNATTGATETLAVEPSHKMTMDQNCTFTFMTPPTLGYTFVLHLLGAFTPTFPAAVDWDAGAAPTYVGTGNGSLFVFTTTDTGTTWLGTLVGSAFA